MKAVSQDFLSRLRRLRVNVNSRRTGIHKGTRRSHKFGSSQEFSDFRAYQPGDDVRQIDWNVYGRTQRHYIKRFLDEQEIKAAIYLDCTSSMRAVPEKWRLAKQVAASLSYIILSNEDRMSFMPISAPDKRTIERKGAVHAKSAFIEIMNVDLDNQTASFVSETEKILQKGKQLSFVITDGLEQFQLYHELLRKLAVQKSRVVFIQVLSKNELVPAIIGDAKLIDSEQFSEVNVSASQRLLVEYKKRVNAHNSQLEQACTELGFTYVLVSDEKAIDDIILKDFVLRGIVQ